MDQRNFDQHYPDMTTELQNRVEERMRYLGLKAAPLAKKAGLGESFVRDILRGKTAVPKADNLARLARALETTPDALLGSTVTGANHAGLSDELPGGVLLTSSPLPFGGEVRAGGFFSADEYFSQDNINFEVPASIVRNPNPKFAKVHQFAWLVHGDSMDLVGISDGMWVVAVPFLEYRDNVGELFNGLPVIVERTLAGGQEIERTIKEFQFTRGGTRLVPRSSNRTHQALFVPDDPDADNDTKEIKILAVVLSAVKDYSRPPEP